MYSRGWHNRHYHSSDHMRLATAAMSGGELALKYNNFVDQLHTEDLPGLELAGLTSASASADFGLSLRLDKRGTWGPIVYQSTQFPTTLEQLELSAETDEALKVCSRACTRAGLGVCHSSLLLLHSFFGLLKNYICCLQHAPGTHVTNPAKT